MNAPGTCNKALPRLHNRAMKNHQILIAGAGPTGLMLGAELTLAGVDVALVERRPSQDLPDSRAGGLHARTIEVLDMRGVADRFVSEGKTYPALGFHLVPLDITDFPTRHPYLLALFQNRIERILGEWVAELGVTIYRDREVMGLTQDSGGVDVAISDGSSMRCEYLVGCDGGRSVVRKAAGIDFPGWDATMSWLIAETQTTEEPAWGMRNDALGIHAIAKADGGQARIVLTEPEPRPTAERTMDDLREMLFAVYGTDFGAHDPNWISSFTDTARQAATYRNRRILLAGDAAHVHPPMGGQGLNIGVQDAVNLGWKLAQVVKQISPDSLLDTYHGERHPIGARVLQNTMAQVALRRSDDRSKALGTFVAEFQHDRASQNAGCGNVRPGCSL
jgi:3-(3-hydroxy-phenyl)propionate hydroxylase